MKTKITGWRIFGISAEEAIAAGFWSSTFIGAHAPGKPTICFMCVAPTVYMHQCVYLRVYFNATSETYPLSRKPAFIGVSKANVSVAIHNSGEHCFEPAPSSARLAVWPVPHKPSRSSNELASVASGTKHLHSDSPAEPTLDKNSCGAGDLVPSSTMALASSAHFQSSSIGHP